MKRAASHFIALNLLLGGIRKVDRDIFGGMNNPIVRELGMSRKRYGPPRQSPAQGRVLCKDPMPLSITERDLLAGFPSGKAKKRFVKQLKIKYGKV